MDMQVYGNWLPETSRQYIDDLNQKYSELDSNKLESEINKEVENNLKIHENECINLNPATNVMNPRAEAVLAKGIGSRPSLGYPGDKYEMGLEAIEKIEIIATRLACEIFNSKYAEIRVASGAMANLYGFMATCQPGDAIIVPPASIGGHVTHNNDGAAGLYGLNIQQAPINAARYTVDVDQLRQQAREIKPKLITIGSSLNLLPHPVGKIREIADEVGARVLFDAAHQCGMIAGQAWQQPLEEGAHLMTFSTYKSLGGPPSGLIVTNDDDIAQRLDAIAFPGLTANFDAAKSASLAIALLDWKEFGRGYAAMMSQTAGTLAQELAKKDIPVFQTEQGFTQSHQFAIEAANYGGGQQAAKHLRKLNILTCGIGLPIEHVQGDMNGLRIGTPEIVRWGMKTEHMAELADFIARGLDSNQPEKLANEVTEFRQQFNQLHYVR